MSDNGSDIGAFMAGFVIGGLVGAATALILAPQSGEETRSQIASRGAEIRMAGEERIGEYRTMAGDVVQDARTRVQDSTASIQEQARIVLDEGKSKVNTAVEKGKQRVEGLTANNEGEG
jgi:gas vesicle protein